MLLSGQKIGLQTFATRLETQVSWKILIVAVIVVSSCFVELEALLIFSSVVLCQMLEWVIMWFY